MIYKNDCTSPKGVLRIPKEYLAQLAEQGLQGLPDLVRVLVNEAMRIERENYLGAKPYERNEERQGHANGYKPKMVKTRVGEVTTDISYVGEEGFYLCSLEISMHREQILDPGEGCQYCEYLGLIG